MADPEVEQDSEPEARDDRDDRKFGRKLGGRSSAGNMWRLDIA